jgi:hypothetical protein
MWPSDHMQGTPLQRPAEYGERRFLTDEEYAERAKRLNKQEQQYEEELKKDQIGMGHWTEIGEAQRLTSLIVKPKDGQLPELTKAGKEKSETMRSSWQDIEFDGVEDFDTWDRCITRGIPASMFPFMYNNGFEIRQAPGYVAIRMEMIHETRIVPIGGKKLDEGLDQWIGHSRGHWEGNTLVVVTENFNGKVPMLNVGTIGAPQGNNIPTSKDLKVIERFTPVAEGVMNYEIRVEDPLMKEPWVAAYAWKRDNDYEIFEYACHEDNKTIRDYINAFQAEEVAQEGSE